METTLANKIKTEEVNDSFTLQYRIYIAVLFFVLAIIGFMVKLPSAFRHFDKELHAAFYFLAAAFLTILFAKTKLLRHFILIIVLGMFGIAIEFCQAYSNKFLHKRIHGRFDPEDVQWNLKGLVAFSLLWLIFRTLVALYKKNNLLFK